MPERVQMHRRKGGWRKGNPNAVIVARPSRWGNPFKVGEDAETAEQAVDMFNCMFHDPWDWAGDYPMSQLEELRGKDLACWCPLDQPCHADVLLKIVNEDMEQD